MAEQEIIRELANQYLNIDGQREVEEYISEQRFDLAKIYVASAVDSLWCKKEISDAEMGEAYEKLNIDLERISRIRQNSEHWK